MKSAIAWRTGWAVIGLLAMGGFFWVFEEITRDSPPLWLQVAVAVGGAVAWLKFGDQGLTDLPNSDNVKRDLSTKFKRAWAGDFGLAVKIVAAILILGGIVYIGFQSDIAYKERSVIKEKEDASNRLSEMRLYMQLHPSKEARQEMLDRVERGIREGGPFPADPEEMSLWISRHGEMIKSGEIKP